MFVVTNRFSLWQAYFCHNKKQFVMTNVCLLWQTHVCHNKTFVMKKVILVAAPTNNRMDVWLNEWTDKPISLFICFLCSRPPPYSNVSSPKLCSLCWWCAMCLWKKPWRLLTKCLTSVTTTLSRWDDDPGKIHVTPTEHCWKDSTMGTANSSGHNCEGVLEFLLLCVYKYMFFCF